MTRVFLISVSRTLSLLPRRAVFWLGGLLGSLWFYALRFRKNVVRENLQLALGGTQDPQALEALAHANFRHYGRTILEIGQSLCWDTSDYLERVGMEGAENALRLTRSGIGAFGLASHLGNWELAVATAAAHGVPIDMVVKRPPGRQTAEFLEWYRKKTGAGVFPETGTAKDILRSISRGRFVVFILDQFMGPPIGLPVSFFGRQAGTVVSLALLTEKREIPVLPVYSYRDSRGQVHGVIEPPLAMPEMPAEKNERLFRKTQVFNDVIEARVRRYPDQWLWLHRRWKEYRGVPRWLPGVATTTALFAAVLFSAVGCVSAGDTPTGIPLPPDPTINMPQFRAQATGDSDTPSVPEEVVVIPKGKESTSPTPTATPIPTPAPTVSPEAKGKKKKRHPKAPVVATPAATATSETSYYSVVPSDRVPFEVGEQMEIDLTWMAIPAGRVTLEVRDGVPFNGRPTFLLWGNLLSSKVADTIYHVDNTIESYIDKEGFIPYKFLLHMVESAQKKETRVSFDHRQNKAYYWAQRLSKKWGDEKQDRVDTIRPHSRDMFSAIYFARTLNYSLNEKQIFPIYENNQNLDVEMLPVANELVRTKAGTFQCWKILVTVKLNNVLRPTGDVYLWLSDDSKKYVVKFDAKLKIGSLYGNLVSIRERQ